MKPFKSIAVFAAALAIGLTMAIGNAEAARIGGGKSVGMQRQMTPISKPATAAPQTAAQHPPPPPPPLPRHPPAQPLQPRSPNGHGWGRSLVSLPVWVWRHWPATWALAKSLPI